MFLSRNSQASKRHQNTNIALNNAVKEHNGLATSLMHELRPIMPIIFNTKKKIQRITF